jgi:hypothetical protein
MTFFLCGFKHFHDPEASYPHRWLPQSGNGNVSPILPANRVQLSVQVHCLEAFQLLQRLKDLPPEFVLQVYFALFPVIKPEPYLISSKVTGS